MCFCGGDAELELLPSLRIKIVRQESPVRLIEQHAELRVANLLFFESTTLRSIESLPQRRGRRRWLGTPRPLHHVPRF
jgi:hypothetical protein